MNVPGIVMDDPWGEISAELHDLFPGKTVVCVTHLRFIPCRKTDGSCIFSSADYDVKTVRDYHNEV